MRCNLLQHDCPNSGRSRREHGATPTSDPWTRPCLCVHDASVVDSLHRAEGRNLLGRCRAGHVSTCPELVQRRSALSPQRPPARATSQIVGPSAVAMKLSRPPWEWLLVCTTESLVAQYEVFLIRRRRGDTARSRAGAAGNALFRRTRCTCSMMKPEHSLVWASGAVHGTRSTGGRFEYAAAGPSSRRGWQVWTSRGDRRGERAGTGQSGPAGPETIHCAEAFERRRPSQTGQDHRARTCKPGFAARTRG